MSLMFFIDAWVYSSKKIKKIFKKIFLFSEKKIANFGHQRGDPFRDLIWQFLKLFNPLATGVNRKIDDVGNFKKIEF